ncbi:MULTISPECIES: hypothetical protein [unclassified Rathayibacter]|uniref:hypothetical protein n=1 Tax=unclassified Rathayibacter TaxID=2609250 RepID=UPI00188AC557|nr:MULTISPECIES: hypothetical protein [unclassified Rathayibacter]MBF4461161.1 hypothetical protein [Rathayibacter sp. VKM Ac-2879]MBF4502572.1 hypothetical protein [Rathayibacter sp. VKM Ac-2878]
MRAHGTPVALRSRLVLDGTAAPLLSGRRFVRDAAVITFWMQFHNTGSRPLHDLVLCRGSFTDGSGTELDYDEEPVTVVGRAERVGPGAGFVVVAHHTAARLRRPRLLRHSVALRGTTADGLPFDDEAGLEVWIDSHRVDRRMPLVRFTPSIAPLHPGRLALIDGGSGLKTSHPGARSATLETPRHPKAALVDRTSP